MAFLVGGQAVRDEEKTRSERRAAHLSPLLAGHHTGKAPSFVNTDNGKDLMNPLLFSGKVEKFPRQRRSRHLTELGSLGSDLEVKRFPPRKG